MDQRKSADDIIPALARTAASDMQSQLIFVGPSINKITIIHTNAMGIGDDGSELFEGTRNLRRVVVKRFQYNDETDEATFREAKIHYSIENDVESIVQLYEVDKSGSHIYLSFEPWTCSLGDLIRICASKSTALLTEERRSFLKEFLGGIKLWETSGGPSILLVDIIRDVVSGVSKLHGAGIIHRNLNSDCFFMIRKGNTFLSRIGNLSFCKKVGDIESDALPKRLAPEQKGKNPVEGLTNDIFFLGLVFGFAITKGLQVFQNDLVYNPIAKNVLQRLPESHQFFKNCTKTPWNLRVSAQTALLEPFFWSTDRIVRFYNIANNLLAGSYWSADLKDSLDTLYDNLVNDWHRGWFSNLEPHVVSKIRNSYNSKNITHLVRLVRNKLEHYQKELDPEKDDGLQEILGTNQKDVLDYFSNSFPQLLLQTYHVINSHFKRDSTFIAFAESNSPQVPVSKPCMVGSARQTKQVACPTCTMPLQVQVPITGLETFECGDCKSRFHC